MSLNTNPYLLWEKEAQSNNVFLLQESLVTEKEGKKEQNSVREKRKKGEKTTFRIYNESYESGLCQLTSSLYMRQFDGSENRFGARET